ncbi:hypothetical protein F966_01908 [Acinetobacter higginsii]|uniref:FilE C-terminal domain-containing protein n=1 Tax=Acinetobacter higginsii TaxID=70347 RepID=N8WBF6_9GAMM|nr:putative pilus assembly protein FilE [Acinetobacter higginsii]ENV09256.1 hypothetical protein F966_01908 [Acinetobacter higginsii]
MQKKRTQQSALAISLLLLMVSSVSTVYADGFYTIIGPDGRPMVVPMKIGKKEAEPRKQQQEPHAEKASQPTITKINPVETGVVPLEQKRAVETPKSFENKQSQQNTAEKILIESKVPEPKVIERAVDSSKTTKIVNNKSGKESSVPTKKLSETQVSSNPLTIEKPTVEKTPTVVEKIPLTKSVSNSSNETTSIVGFNKVDGVDYVNNEYLENQEFNLDGKKRFYTIPDGTGRTETIERKKGVSRSVLDKLLNRSQQSTAPIVLSGTYIRLSSDDLKLAFENDRCFLEGYKKSIKTLTLKKDIGLWPRKPLKEKFEYELVKLDTSIQYMQIDSYSSNNEKPVYYWPLVVFLDEKGCIEEGVSGFKNSKTAATVLQHSGIQGVIKVPVGAHYMMMTPLASAVDVSEQELSNQGQIKISVLQ